MPKPKRKNPFYVALLVVGTLFAVTACAYTATTVRGMSPLPHHDSAGDTFFGKYGFTIMVVELAVLGVLTFAAILTDDYWTAPAAATGAAKNQDESAAARDAAVGP